ncbi:MAG: type 1 glutamine amidotransferase [bacterium]|nr:type 1 glutamine amidotransferase [bacterium]
MPFEGLGSIKPWAKKRGHKITCSRLYRNDVLPPIDALDWLIVMGGPMSVHDESSCSWLPQEQRFIEAAMEAGKTVLGICLGAQLIAKVLGARIYKNRYKEIGWFPVRKSRGFAPEGIAGALTDGVTAFHWHGETFDLPAGAVKLASSEACKNQAFALENRVVGLQYHLETTRSSAETLIDNCSHEIVEAPYIQTAEQMLADPARFSNINDEMRRVLGYLETLTRR